VFLAIGVGRVFAFNGESGSVIKMVVRLSVFCVKDESLIFKGLDLRVDGVLVDLD